MSALDAWRDVERAARKAPRWRQYRPYLFV